VRVEAGGEPGQFRAEFRFGPQLAVFRGHFPGRPLVPGVFIIEMVRLAAERGVGRRCRISRVASAKFTGEIAPGELVVVTGSAAAREGGLAVKGELRVGEALKARVSMLLVAPPT
jgi:3-hydroxyacyl-[acyl-carrier-protein] dehydratase